MIITIFNKEVEVFIMWKDNVAGLYSFFISYKVVFGKVIFTVPEGEKVGIVQLADIIMQDWETIEKQIEKTKDMYLVKRTRHELFLLLKKYVKKYEQIMGVKVVRFKISPKPMKDIWANCRGRGYLTFNCQCTQLPERVIEAVVVHEMTHIFYKDHSRRFWDKFEEFLPEARKRDEEIDLYTDYELLDEEVKRYVEQEV